MSTIDPSKVKAGDTVTLTGPAKRAWVAGPVSSVTHVGGGEWDIRIDGLSTYRVGRIGVWTLTAHQPAPVPEWEPGTVYEITTPDGDTVRAWYLKHVRGGSAFVTRDGDEFTAEELASIQPVPDDAERLRRSLEVAHEGYLKAAAGWRTQIGRMGAEVDRLEAEVERLRAARTREQIAKVLFRATTGTASEANAGADAVLTLLEEGGAS